MATVYLYPSGTTFNNLTVTGAATAHECLDDPHGSESEADNISGTSSGSQSAYGSLDDMPAGVGSITSIQTHGRTRSDNTNYLSFNFYNGATTQMGINSSPTTGSFVTKSGTVTTTDPWTTGAWTVSNVNSYQWYVARGADLGIYKACSAGHFDVIYSLAAGGWIWSLKLWVPPLLGLIGANLQKGEIFNFLKRECVKWGVDEKGRSRRVYPSLDSEWEKLRDALVRRPVFAGV